MRNGRDRTHRRRVRGTLESNGRLRMTSMMDILVVLLLFLLKSFVVESEAVTPVPGVELPRSTSKELPTESVHLVILDGGILMNGEPVAAAADWEGPELLIEPLARELLAVRDRTVRLARLKGHEDPAPTMVTVQGDRGLEFRILQRVMFTLSQTGFPDVSLAVIKDG